MQVAIFSLWPERTEVIWVSDPHNHHFPPLLPLCWMEQGQGRLLPATWRRNSTHLIWKLSTGVLLTEHKAESLDALLDITYLVGTMLKVHPLAAWNSHNEQSGRGGSHGVPQVNSKCLIGYLSLLLSAGSLEHHLLWKLIFTKYVSCLM